MSVTSKPTSRLREYLLENILIADGAMGTMIQNAQPSLEDFQMHEGCNEILNITRPELITRIHKAYLDVGVDAIETNTFGANLANLQEYGIEDRIYELAYAGAKIARDIADQYPGKFVLGSVGPGTKLPTLGHISYRQLRDHYEIASRALIDGGCDAILIETTQDLLQAKAAINGARKAIEKCPLDILVIAQVTVETTGTMLLGTEIDAALNSLSALKVDLIGMNCATGPTEMSEHLRILDAHSSAALSCMPNAGLPVLQDGGAFYPLSPKEMAKAILGFTQSYGLRIVGGCCGTTPEHLAEIVSELSGVQPKVRAPSLLSGASSLYQFTSFKQDNSYLAIGERANANGSRAFRDALLADNWEACVEIVKEQIRDGAHMIDLSVDYVGRNGVRDISELAFRIATSSTLPVILDSTEPAVLEAGLERLGGKCVINSVNYEDGDGPDSRFAKIMPLVDEHGAAVIALTIDERGQARTSSWKIEVADRLVEDLTEKFNLPVSDIIIDCLTFPIATGQEETRRDAIETLTAIKEIKRKYPEINTTLGISNVSFGLNSAARIVLNSVFLDEAVKAGLDSAIVHASKIMPIARIPLNQQQAALDLIYDRRLFDQGECIFDPLSNFLEMFMSAQALENESNKERIEDLPLETRLSERIIRGEKIGLEDDLQEALDTGKRALEIINGYLLEGMRKVGELFGSGQMQLPFVLQSAEVMKKAVAWLEPHIEKIDGSDRGSILLATVKGDVHDIGKNLVDIILSNNGYTVHNIGIKQTINQIIDAANEFDVDVIGMSGLLVKSTVIMSENLEELSSRGLAQRWPVILGGAALTRTFVEADLAPNFAGTVRYAKDAFEGLSLMESLIAIKRGDTSVSLPPLKERRTAIRQMPDHVDSERSDVSRDITPPVPPFWGERIIKGIPLSDYLNYLDERALFVGQWGLKVRGDQYQEMLEEEGRPRLRALLNDAQSQGWFNAAVTYGYFPCQSSGNELIIYDPFEMTRGVHREIERFTFPRQRRDRRLCLSDFFQSVDSGQMDTVAFHIVTMGSRISEITGELFARDEYRKYLELHGLSVQLTEALAEYWHFRIRDDLGLTGEDAQSLSSILDQGYRGSRYSFGYPACPDISQQVALCRLLLPERIGVALSEEFQLHPEQSTSAIILHHPEAKYFNAN
jgi:5-methyltetrahydrofolate--homocysteine methyltransferase